jgi:oligoribonuclease (3'-5' exoribonuclease)
MNSIQKKKSKTQMTKSELISLLKEHEVTIKSLETNMSQLRDDRIALDTIVTDSDTSMLITGLNARIKALEEKVKDMDNRKPYE